MQIPSIQIQKKINGFFYGLKDLFNTKSFIFSGNTAYISHKLECCLYCLHFPSSFDTFACSLKSPRISANRGGLYQAE